MEVTVRGKHVEVSESVIDRARRKLGHLDHYLPLLRDATVEVDVAEERAKEPARRYVVRVLVNGNGVHLRAEEHAAKPEAAIDLASHALAEQARRHKQRLYERSRTAKDIARQSTEEMAAALPGVAGDLEEDLLSRVSKIKRFPVKPMARLEALEQMESLGHNFFLFLDAELDQFALLYRRSAGDIGLIIPEPS